MATIKFPISHITPIFLSSILLFHFSSILCFNITTLLSSYPDLSDFNNLLTSTSVAADLSQRSSITLLVVPNSYLRSPTVSDLTHRTSPGVLADILRYHVLLQYFSSSELHLFPIAGKLVTTLYQTTGRATNNLGAVNITRNPTDNSIAIHSTVAYSSSNITILNQIITLPYNVSIFAVNSLLVPYNFDLMASENRPPMGLNITRVLIDGKNFNVAASMLMASGVAEEFEQDEAGAGITMFVPTDEAFADPPTTEKLQSLPADRKAVVLKFHVLHSYYPLGSLESIVNPVQPTLATEDMGAGRFTLNITRLNGSVAIDTGLVLASITQTVFDQNPVAIFAVSKVLLPREIFGKESLGEIRSPSFMDAPPPDASLSPETAPGLDNPPTHLSSPNDAIRSGVGRTITSITSISIGSLFCIALMYVLV